MKIKKKIMDILQNQQYWKTKKGDGSREQNGCITN